MCAHPFRADVRTLLPGPFSRRLLDRQAARESAALAYPRDTPIALAGGLGAYALDADGNVFLDFLTGAGVLVLGHNHPERLAAAHAQFDAQSHAVDFPTEAKGEFTERLIDRLLAPMRGRTKIHFCGPTGADGVEAVVKLCKTYTGRGDVVAFAGGFHGSIQGAPALTGLAGVKEPLRDLNTRRRVLPVLVPPQPSPGTEPRHLRGELPAVPGKYAH
jgi:diaminobutyrate-2-oxoglutarate transaminase